MTGYYCNVVIQLVLGITHIYKKFKATISQLTNLLINNILMEILVQRDKGIIHPRRRCTRIISLIN